MTRRRPLHLFEWTLSAALLAVGAHAAAVPGALAESRIGVVLNIAPRPVFCAVAIGASLARFCALALPALGRWAPRMRAAGSLVGAVVWGQLAVALALAAPEDGVPVSPAVWLYVAVCAGEFASTYRATVDAGRP